MIGEGRQAKLFTFFSFFSFSFFFLLPADLGSVG